MIRYSIKDLEKLTGIKAHTIRIWEKRYKLIEPSRTLTNIRTYTDDDLRRLMNVAILNKYGFKISNIAGMTPSEISKSVLEISQNDHDNQNEVESLVLSMIEMDEQRFEKILSSAIIRVGFENTITDILNKFLEKIGVLWQIGTITPAQEHFVSNLIRQKLIMAIDGQNGSHSDSTHTFLMFLPADEYHEMGLLYYHYLTKKAGHTVIYLGQNVPTQNLEDIAGIKPFDYVVTSITTSMPDNGLQEYINRLSSLFPDKKILIGGYQFQDYAYFLPENMILLNNPHDYSGLLETI